MKPCDTTRMGVSPRQVARHLSQQHLRGLLTTLAQSPTGVVMKVGYLVRLFVALVTAGLSTPDRIGRSGNRGGRAAVPETSRRAIRVAGGASAAARRGSSLMTDKEDAVAFIATAKNEMKGAMRTETRVANGRGVAVKRSGGGEKANQAQLLKSWAAKAKRSVPSLCELLESGRTTLGAEDARLFRFHTKDTPVEKAERVRIAATEVCNQSANVTIYFVGYKCQFI